MKLFDRLCMIAEKNPDIPELIALRHGALFYTDKVIEPVEREDFERVFAIPFRTTIAAFSLEMTAGEEAGEIQEVILAVTDKYDNQVGMKSRRDIIVFEQYEKTSTIAIGDIELRGGEGWKLDASVRPSAAYRVYNSNRAELVDSDEEEYRGTGGFMTERYLLFLRYMSMVNDLGRIIVRQSPLKQKKAKGGKIRRQHQRPVYTAIYPRVAYEEYGLGKEEEREDGKRKNRPHWRRRHLRRYPDDPERYPNAHGETIVIPHIWVGPDKVEVNGKRYRVMLDK